MGFRRSCYTPEHSYSTRSTNILTFTSQSTDGRVDLGRHRVHAADERAITADESIERRQTDIEAGIGVVDREDIDRVRSALWDRVLKLPARPAVGRAPAGNRGCAADVWKVREVAERVVRGVEAVRSVRARDGQERLCGVVIGGVVRDSHGILGERAGGEERKGGDDAGELHGG